MSRPGRRSWVGVVLVLFILASFAFPAAASHSWGNYHWARTANPFTLKLGDNVSSTWDSYLSTTSSDWSASSVLNTTIVAGSTRPKNCRPTSGRVEVCTAAYGNTGWLGVAQIWVSGNHIYQATAKMNDTYFGTSTYNTPAWRNLVMCQEVGHTFGLDHQDENFDNQPLGTCMDYSSDPEPNQHPNQHDYDQLETIYAHLDSTTTVSSTGPATPGRANGDFHAREEWGTLVRSSPDGRLAMYERDLGKGFRLVTHVFWAE